MTSAYKDVGFSFKSEDLEKTKYFNLDGSMAIHVDVWVEAYDDQRFWLAHLPRNAKYKFFPKTPDRVKAPDKKYSTGCGRLFKLEKQGVIVLGPAQIFCVDSDDSYLKGFIPGYQSPKQERAHVYVTNVYSVENVMLYPELVDRTFESVSGVSCKQLPSLPSNALSIISALVHELVLALAFYDEVVVAVDVEKNYRDEFEKIIASFSEIDFRNDFSKSTNFSEMAAGLEGIRSELVSHIINSGSEQGYLKFKADVENAGYDAECAYLFVRGHTLYDGVVGSLSTATNEIRSVEIERLQGIYKDHDQRSKCVENQWPSFDHSLKAGYLAALPEINFFSRSLTRLNEDYA